MSDPKLSLVIATLHQPDWRRCVDSWALHACDPFNAVVIEGRELMEAYQMGLEATAAPIVGFVHDDVIVGEDDWDLRVLREFDDPEVGLVGFGGALGHGDPDMYKKPYALGQLARRRYRSNMRDAERHGERFTMACDVAVLDGFALFVRRQVLEAAVSPIFDEGPYPDCNPLADGPDLVGGWPRGTPCGYIGYDYWISCISRRQGYRIRMVGVACDHLGGRSTGLAGPDFDAKFEAAHRYIYDTCHDALPYAVPR